MKKTAIVTTIGLLANIIIPHHIQAAGPSGYTPAPWPAEFKEYTTQDGSSILDIAGESGISPASADLTSGIDDGTGTKPTVYYASDGTNVFFRIRIKDNPFDVKGGYTSTFWLVNLAVNGQHKATIGLNGKGASIDYVYVTHVDDPDGVPIYETDASGENVPGSRIVPAENGQYFVDFQVPIETITAVAPEITGTTPLQIFFGSSQSANLAVINKDYMSGSAVSFNNLLKVRLGSIPSIEISGGEQRNVSDSRPAVTGITNAPNGSQVRVSIDGHSYTGTVSDGQWSVNVGHDLANGTYPVTAAVTDDLGNTVRDTQTLVYRGIQIAITSSSQENDTTPTISGTTNAADGSTVRVRIDGKDYSTLASGGTWSVTVPAADALQDATYAVEAAVTEAGTDLRASVNGELKVDTVTDVAIGSPTDGETVTVKRPALSGTVEAGSTVKVKLDNGTWADAAVTGTTWSYTLASDLSEGSHLLEVQATDGAGNQDHETSHFMVDTVTDVAIGSPTDGETVAVKRPVLSGTVEAGSTVKVKLDNGTWADAAVTGTTWSYTPTADLAEGNHQLMVQATDARGNQDSKTGEFTVDTATNVAISSPTDGETVAVKRPALSGTVEAGSTVKVKLDNGTWADAAVTGTTWSYTPTVDLADGGHQLAVQSTDSQGNQAAAASSFVVDTITEVTLDSPANGSTVNEKRPVISGTAEVGATVEIRVDGGSWQRVDLQGVSWSYTPAYEMEEGTHTIEVRATDQSGNRDSRTGTVLVKQPSSIAIAGGSEVRTSDLTPVIAGSAQVPDLSKVTVSIVDASGRTVYTGTGAVVGGSWQFAVGRQLASGTYTVRAATTSQTGTVLRDEQQLIVQKEDAALKMTTSREMIVGDGRSQTEITTLLLDENGSPIVGERVKFTAEAGRLSADEAVTDASGRATVILTAPDMSGTITPSIKLVKATVANEEKQLFAEEQIAIHFLPASLKGQVIDSVTKQPLGGSRISIQEDFNDDGIVDFKTAVTADEQGNYEIAVPYGDWTYDLHVAANMQINGTAVPFEFIQKATIGELTGAGDEAEAEQTVSGQLLLLDAENKPVSLQQLFGGQNVSIEPKVLNDEENSLQVHVHDTGAFEITGGEAGKTYDVALNVVADGKTLAGKELQVEIPDDGVAAVQAALIDPYGTVRDAATGNVITGAEVTLYWADTALNRQKSRPVNKLVELPILENFAPNQNRDPQFTDKSGSYAWMVFPDGDYYIVAKKNGYVVYDSRLEKRDVPAAPGEDSYIEDGIIHVGQTIVNYDFLMSQQAKAVLEIADANLTTKVNTAKSGQANKPEGQSGTLRYTVGAKPLHGTLKLRADGSYVYEPSAGYVGKDSFSIVVTNEAGQTGIGIVNVNVEANVLKLQDQSVDLGTNQEISGRMTGEGLDAAGLVYSLVTQPKHGKAEIGPDGTWTYRKTGVFAGEDMFRVRVKDATGAVATAAIRISMREAGQPALEVLPKTGSPLDRNMLMALASALTLGGLALFRRKRADKR